MAASLAATPSATFVILLPPLLRPSLVSDTVLFASGDVIVRPSLSNLVLLISIELLAIVTLPFLISLSVIEIFLPTDMLLF